MKNKEKAPYSPSDFPPFAVTVDLVVLTVRKPGLEVLLVTRGEQPYIGCLALPGGFVGPDQGLLDAAQHKLADKTGIDLDRAYLEQLGTFGTPKRDPRMRVVSVTYLAMVPDPGPAYHDDADWQLVDELNLEALAFDHADILSSGIERARAKLEYTTLATSFCGETFTVVELRGVYEAVWGLSLDPANFHRKLLAADGFLIPTNQTVSQGRGRPAQLYRAGATNVLHPPIARARTPE